MPARILLTITDSSQQASITISERMTCIVGRGRECYPGLVLRDKTGQTSRHHCLLDINPPDIRIRDFGSLNGTFVNGRLIGRRTQLQAEGNSAAGVEWDLKHGDVIGINDVRIVVNIELPPRCTSCAAELPEWSAAEPSRTLCDNCCQFATATFQSAAKPDVKCSVCGKNVATEAVAARGGAAYICYRCRDNQGSILQSVLTSQSLGSLPFEVIRPLGQGGMGSVYLVRHRQRGDLAALKIMLPAVASDALAQALFLREMRNMQALRHAHVVQMQQGGCENSVFFCLLDFCDSGDLAALARSRGGRLPIAEALHYIAQALDGLEYAHSAEIPEVRLADGTFGRGRGLVHRDLKPSNIFLHKVGNQLVAKVGDYGLAKAFDAAGMSGQTFTGARAGTPSFLPRQQVLNFKHARPDVDVWAAAASLYFLLCGQVPRNFTKDQDVWLTVLNTKPVPIRQRDPSIPPRLASLLDAALDDSAQLAFASAAQFKQELLAATK